MIKIIYKDERLYPQEEKETIVKNQICMQAYTTLTCTFRTDWSTSTGYFLQGYSIYYREVIYSCTIKGTGRQKTRHSHASLTLMRHSHSVTLPGTPKSAEIVSGRTNQSSRKSVRKTVREEKSGCNLFISY